MGFFQDKYPHTEFHELNLDWIIKEIEKLNKYMNEFEVINQIKFMGQWEIQQSYPIWSIVDSDNIGYISITPVPAGIELTNTNYWRQVANYSALLADFENRIIALENASSSCKMYSIGYNQSGIESNNYQMHNVIKLANGKNLLIDTGCHYEDVSIQDFYNNINVDKIDYVVISHYHDDHAGNFAYLASFLDMSGATIYLPAKVDPDVVSGAVLALEAEVEATAAANNMIVIRPGEKQIVNLDDNIALQFYNTVHAPYYADPNFDYNNCSLVVKLINGITSILFPGDIMDEAQTTIASELEHVTAAFMAHHGVNTYVIDEYFNAIHPDFYFCANGNGTSNVGNADFLNQYSGENGQAQRHNIIVVPTSEQADYIIKAELNSSSIGFDAKSISNKRALKMYDCMVDITGKGLSYNRDVPARDLYDAIPNNTMALFSTPNYMQAAPNLSGNVTNLIYKTNSSSSANNYEVDDPRVYHLIGIYQKNVYGTPTDVFEIRAGRQGADLDETDFSMNILSGNLYSRFTLEGTTGTGTVQQVNIEGKDVYMGDDFTLNPDGTLTCNVAGVYLLNLLFWTTTNSDDPYTLQVEFNNDSLSRCAVSGVGIASRRKYDSGVQLQYIHKDDIIKVTANANTTFDGQLLIVSLSRAYNIDKSNFFNTWANS